MIRCFALILCAVLIAADNRPTSGPATAPTTSPAYSIYFDTDKVGARQDVTILVDARRDRSMRRNEKVTWTDRDYFKLELEGTIEVLGVDRGNATKVSVSVDRLELIRDGKRTDVVPRGSVIFAEQNGSSEPRCSLKDGEIDPQMAWYVQRVVDVYREGEPTSQQLYGPPGTQPVGASWPINLRQLARLFAVQSMTLQQDASSGTIRFLGIEQHDGAQYAHIQAEIAADVRYESEGWRQTSGRTNVVLARLMPTDPSRSGLDSSIVYDGTMTFLRHVGKNQSEREVSEDRMLRMTEIKVRRTYPATKPS